MTGAGVEQSGKVVFLHVQKTGGMTFRGMLSSVYGDSFHLCDDPSLDGVASDLAKFDCLEFHPLPRRGELVCTHSEFAAGRGWNLLQGAHIFTMLRDPVDQAVSLYYHILRVRDTVEPLYRAQGIPFPESLEQFAQYPPHFNNQLKYLTGSLQLTARLTRQDLNRAKDLLLSLEVHVGLTEQYGDSLHVFESVTGRKIPGGKVENRNQNPNRPQLDEIPRALIDRIREQSRLDFELYEFGGSLLEQDLRRYGKTAVYSFGNSAPAGVPCKSAVECGFQRAVEYLQNSQLPGGEFQTEFSCPRPQEADGGVVQDLVSDSSPFVTSLVLYSLQFVRELEAVPAMIERACRFLVSEMEPGGLWRYWSRRNGKRAMIPPDLDDTSCISHCLQQNGFPIPDNRWLLHDSRDSRGAFFTWLYKADSLRKWFLSWRTRGQAFSWRQEVWQGIGKDDVCAVVNANVILYLGDSPATRRAIAYLKDVIQKHSEDRAIVFYAHPLSLYYMLSRAYFHGVTAFAGIKPILAERIAAFRRSDGSYGDELLTGMAICALVNLRADFQPLAGAVKFLLQTQRPDGSWRRVPAYGGPPVPTTFGSADLTTAICLEALARSGASAHDS